MGSRTDADRLRLAELGRTVRQRRLRLGLTLRDLAKLSGVTKGRVEGVELGLSRFHTEVLAALDRLEQQDEDGEVLVLENEYEPTPAEILAMCRGIQSEWSPSEWRQRLRGRNIGRERRA